MPHDHSHVDEHTSDGRLVAAIGLNLLLALAEAIAGLVAGSLALLADALHNFQDCAALVIALIARRIGRRPSDDRRTFGYRRAEIIGALINLTVLVVLSIYLVYEALARLFQPPVIDGWVVVVVAAIAVAVNLATAMLLHAMSHGSLNIRAAYLHNLGDAVLSSLGVIAAGVAILWWNATWFDAVITIAIAAFILWQSFGMMSRSIHILMQSAPADVDTEALIADLQSVPGVLEVHHMHLWELDEEHRSLEAHVVVDDQHVARWAEIKLEMKSRLGERYRIHHSTLEFETLDEQACHPCPPATNCHHN